MQIEGAAETPSTAPIPSFAPKEVRVSDEKFPTEEPTGTDAPTLTAFPTYVDDGDPTWRPTPKPNNLPASNQPLLSGGATFGIIVLTLLVLGLAAYCFLRRNRESARDDEGARRLSEPSGTGGDRNELELVESYQDRYYEDQPASQPPSEVSLPSTSGVASSAVASEQTFTDDEAPEPRDSKGELL